MRIYKSFLSEPIHIAKLKLQLSWYPQNPTHCSELSKRYIILKELIHNLIHIGILVECCL